MISALSLFVWIFQETQSFIEEEVNAPVCQDASRSFLITSLTMAAVVALLAVLLKRYWDKRQAWTLGVRLGLSVAIAFVAGSALVAWNPVKGKAFVPCLESIEFSRYIIMAHVAAVPRGLVLGGLAAVGFYFLFTVIVGLISRR